MIKVIFLSCSKNINTVFHIIACLSFITENKNYSEPMYFNLAIPSKNFHSSVVAEVVPYSVVLVFLKHYIILRLVNNSFMLSKNFQVQFKN